MLIGIIGSGSFGTALAKAFSDNNNNIILYSIEKKVISEINNHSENKSYLKGVKLSKNISVTNDLSIFKYCDVIFLAVPSSAYVNVCKTLKPHYIDQIIVSASKGIGSNGEVLTDIIELNLDCDPKKVLVLTGPSIALELALKKPTQVILAGNRAFTQLIKNSIETDYFFIRCTRDKKGVQYLGFYKNILAILVGLCEGLELGNNMKSALITKAYSEFYFLNQDNYIRKHSFIDYAGMGDLYLTSTSDDSRNRRFGKLLAKNTSIKKILKELGQVVEGYDNLLRLKYLLDNNKDSSWFEKNLLNTLLAIFNSRKPEIKKKLLVDYLHSSEIKALVFDWGNVITKGYYSMDVAKLISKKYNLNKDQLLMHLEKYEKDALLGKDNLKEFYNKIKKVYPMISFKFFYESYYNAITWDNELLKVCKKLSKHYDLYILSNNYNWITPKIKPRLKKIFKGMIFSNEVGMIKPNDDIFDELLNRFNLRPENCIYVDDSHLNILAGERNKFNVVEYKSLIDLVNTLNKKISGFDIKLD